MKIIYSTIVGLILTGLSTLVMANHGKIYYKLPHHPKQHHVQMLLMLNGIKNTYECQVPATNQGTINATCHDHDIIDLKTNKIVGTATDATTDVSEAGGTLVATGTTFFRLPFGELVVRGRGTIQPIAVDSAIMNGTPITHIAGIFPEPGQNNVLSGTGIYKDAEGTFSLLGALDLTNSSQGQMAFNCVFFIDLKLKK